MSVFLTNINWDKDINALRKLELDAFGCTNSGTVNIGVQGYYNALTGTTVSTPLTSAPTSYSPFFIVRKRTLKLIDVWNRILNCGLFNTVLYEGSEHVENSTFLGSGLRSFHVEYPFKATNTTVSLQLGPETILPKIIKFLCMNVKNYNNYLTMVTKSTVQSYFATNGGTVPATNLGAFINTSFNPTETWFWELLEELNKILKECINEELLGLNYGLVLANLDLTTSNGKQNILLLEAIDSSTYKKITRNVPYLNELVSKLGDQDNLTPTELGSFLPQFGAPITRNSQQEAWNIRNVLIDTTKYSKPTDGNFSVYHIPTQVAASQLTMNNPLTFTTQYIDWSNPDDIPYVLCYNGWASIYIPDAIKRPSLVDIQPDNQLNICSSFWSIGQSDKNGSYYNPTSDIKLNMDIDPVKNFGKISYFDNLTIYLKLNS